MRFPLLHRRELGANPNCLLIRGVTPPHLSPGFFTFNQANTPLSNPLFHCDPLWQVRLSAAEGIYLSAVSCVCVCV